MADKSFCFFCFKYDVNLKKNIIFATEIVLVLC